jgi:cation:H+ antiporter
MFLTIAYLVAGLLLLYGGAEGLVRGSSSLSLRMGVTRLVVGLTVVAFGTSSPELVVSVEAALKGSPDIAVGNVVGSNIMNIALILGIACMIYPIRKSGSLLFIQIPIMIAVSAALLLVLMDGKIQRWEGLLLLSGIVCYTAFSIAHAKSIKRKRARDGDAPYVPEAKRKLWLDSAYIGIGGASLVAGGILLIRGAVSIASAIGISQAVIGLTVAAVGTSLPELATSVVASVRGESDISMGNIVGSNIFNILAILGIASLISPLVIENIRIVDLAAMLGAAVLAFVVAASNSRFHRWEGGILVGLYLAYIFYRVSG